MEREPKQGIRCFLHGTGGTLRQSTNTSHEAGSVLLPRIRIDKRDQGSFGGFAPLGRREA